VAFSENLRRPLLGLVQLLVEPLSLFGRLLVHCGNITKVSESSERFLARVDQLDVVEAWKADLRSDAFSEPHPLFRPDICL
jgi:hypothetical protein